MFVSNHKIYTENYIVQINYVRTFTAGVIIRWMKEPYVYTLQNFSDTDNIRFEHFFFYL